MSYDGPTQSRGGRRYKNSRGDVPLSILYSQFNHCNFDNDENNINTKTTSATNNELRVTESISNPDLDAGQSK